MIAVKKNYLPQTLEEALSLLFKEPEARLIAGGTDLLVKARHNRWKDIIFISLCNVKELCGVSKTENGDIHIGPMTTFAKLAENELVKSRLPMLVDAALSMGGPQIRNAATIGGNVCNGAASADSAPALFALDAKLRLVSNKNEREVEISNFYQGPSKVDLLHGEILTGIIIKAIPEGKFKCKYKKFSTRKAMDISTMGCAAAYLLDENGLIKTASIALGTAAPTPVRCREAEAILIGKEPAASLWEKAGEEALKSIQPRSSWRASADYRKALAQALVAQTLNEAYMAAESL